MGCGTGGCGVAAFGGGVGGRGSYAGVVHRMERELAEARGEGKYLADAAAGIRAEVAERGLVPAVAKVATAELSDRSNVVFLVIVALFLLATAAVVTAHVTGYDAALAGSAASDDDDD